MPDSRFRFAISATFTAEPLEPVLQFWGHRLELPVDVAFAPYNQVSQSLLDPASALAQNTRGANVILVRPEDLAQFDPAHPDTLLRIEANLDALAALIRGARLPAGVPLLVVLCPSSAEFAAGPRLGTGFRDALIDAPGVRFIGPEEIDELYPVAHRDSPEGQRLGRVPYSELYFCALGSMLVRAALRLLMPPFKVIALDCDNTLWQGVCGEDGPTGVVIDEPYRALQDFMVRQRQSGMLLTLASKNNERDAVETFEKNPGMPLRLEHFVARRLNWDPKAPNIESMAAELSLGVDSFIFIDDNPKETAELQESLPEVLSLTLPADAGRIPAYLTHIWALDAAQVTAEDRERSRYYAQAQQFGKELQTAHSPEHFLATLELEIDRRPLAPEDLPRVAQLTQRTNQFNCTTQRLSETEIRDLVDSGTTDCWTIRIRDRFGDYGLTGVVFFHVDDGVLCVDNFLLSCRVLGRGVEHRVLAELGKEAERSGCKRVDVAFEPSAKNRPACDFLSSIGDLDSGAYRFAAPDLVHLTPRILAPPPAESRPKAVSAASHKRPDYQYIATHLATPEAIREAMRQQHVYISVGEALTDTESRLIAIWCDLLKRPSVSPSDNFFDLGGHSLLVVLLIARVKENFGIELPIDDVYSGTLTLADLARQIEVMQLGGSGEYDALLAEIEALSDEEVERLLAEEGQA